jgi:hypothetical protein
VKMRQEDRVDVVAGDRKLVHGNERACAAIDQYVGLTPGEVQAGIKSSAGAEGVAAADEFQSHMSESPKRSANGYGVAGPIVQAFRSSRRDGHHNDKPFGPAGARFNPQVSHGFFTLPEPFWRRRRATEKAESRHDRNTKPRILHV